MAMALVFGATGAWAADGDAVVKMTYVDYDNPTTAIGEIAAGETARSGFNKISGGAVGFGNTGWGENKITYIQVDASAIEGTITGATLTAEVSGSSDSKRPCTYGVGYNASAWSADLTYETADKTITLVGNTYGTSTKGANTFETATFDISNALVGDEDKVVTILMYETAAAGGYVKNPSVTVTYLSDSEVGTYTVKYVCGETEVKEATTGVGAIGSNYTVTEDDKASCIFNDVKYIYVSDDAASQAIAADGSTVITITFRQAEKYNYILKSSLGATLKEGADWEGETLNVAYPRYLAQDGTLYSAGKGSAGWYLKTIILNQDNQEETVDYTAGESGVVFLAEAEDIETLTESTAANSNIRCSNGLCAYNAGEGDAVITTLPNGKYKLYTSVWGNADTEFIFKAGDTPIYSIETVGSIKDGNSEEFELNAASTPITLGATANAARGIDFVYIVKTGDAELEALEPAVGKMDFIAMNLPVSSGSGATAVTDGDITEDKTFTADDFSVTISPSTTSTPNRFWSSNGGSQLRVYGGTITVEAVAGKTLNKIVFDKASTFGVSSVDFGTFEGDTWTGDATKVVFTMAKSFINAITVGDYVAPAEPLADAANIAAFKALEKGTKAKLTVNGAKVTFVNGVNTYIEDETGALLLYNAGLNLTAGKALTGYINGAYTEYKGLAELTAIDETAASEFTEADAEVVATVVTVAEANAAESVSKLVKLEDVDIDAEDKLIKQGEAEINFYDKFKVMGDFVYPEYAKSIVGIITTTDGVNSFCPVSPDEVVAGEKVEGVHTWDFTKWSEATVANLKAEAAKVTVVENEAKPGYTTCTDNDALWTDHEKAPGKDCDTYGASKDKCFWSIAAPNENGELTANGEVIAELKGLEFNSSYASSRSLAIALDYPSTSLGTYHGPSYLWFGGSGKEILTIKSVKAGTTIKVGVESHKNVDARGIELYVADEKIEGPAAPKTYEEQEWIVPGETGVVDVVVKNTNGCHIYFIDAEQDLTQVVPTGINTVKTEVENGNIYNLQGQKVQKAQKGLYIINGKKVVIK